MRIGAIGAASNVDIHHSVLARVEIVGDAKRRRNLDRPVSWLEGGVAMEKFKAKLNSLAGGKLFRLSKKLGAAGFVATHVGRCGCASLFYRRSANRRKNQECL